VEFGFIEVNGAEVNGGALFADDVEGKVILTIVPVVNELFKYSLSEIFTIT